MKVDDNYRSVAKRLLAERGSAAALDHLTRHIYTHRIKRDGWERRDEAHAAAMGIITELAERDGAE